MERERTEVPSHPLVEAIFAYARIPWRDNPDVYWEEMPKLMMVICECCEAVTGTSASNVYYHLRDTHEVTALDHLPNKGHKILALSRLMTTMAANGILISTMAGSADRPYKVFTTAAEFRTEAEVQCG